MAAKISPSQWHLVSGLDQIVDFQADLLALAGRTGQADVMQSLDYFLTVPYFDHQVPFNFRGFTPVISKLLSSGRKKLLHLLLRSGPDGLNAAVLLYEHQLHGFPAGFFTPTNYDAYRTVIAQPDQLESAAKEAGDFLLKRGASLVLISYLVPSGAFPRESSSATEQSSDVEPAADFWNVPRLVATQTRDVSRVLPLASTYDATLASMGRHTRRNLRAFQRRVIRDLDAVYVPEVKVSLSEFLELNRASMYTTPDWVARWRHESTGSMAGGIFAGLRAADGNWLSLIGGHHQSETVWLDWQMNLARFASFSPVSAMRAFFIAAQIEQGVHAIRFDGGTPHSMRSAFIEQRARDLLFARKALPPSLVRRIAPFLNDGGPLAQTLRSPALIWRR